MSTVLTNRLAFDRGVFAKCFKVFTKVSPPDITKKPLMQQVERNLFLSASPQAESSNGGKVKYFFGAIKYGANIQKNHYN